MLRLTWFCLMIIRGLSSYDKQLLDINPSLLSDPMKEFMTFMIQKNYREKDGFLFVEINRVDSEFSDFAVKLLSMNGSFISLNVQTDQKTRHPLNPNHFKFVLVDPEGELSHAEHSFRRVRLSRAKIVLILTREPVWIFVQYLLHSYKKVNCFSVIIAYETEGRIEVHTFNPYLPRDNIVNLTDVKYTEDLFREKALNLHGSKVKALLTYPDRTKFRKLSSSKYGGKDFNAIGAIFKHLNGDLEIVEIKKDKSTVNPWLTSVNVANRSGLKEAFLADNKIMLLVKSESFTDNDGIVENLYPHTQNDFVVLVPKSAQTSMFENMSTLFEPSVWVLHFTLLILICLVWVVIKKITKNSNSDLIAMIFELLRLMITSSPLRSVGTSLEKIFLISWIIYCLIMSIAWQSKITSFFTITTYEPEIDTIDRLIESKLKLFAMPSHIEEVEKKYSGTRYENFAKSLVSLRIGEDQLDELLVDENFDSILIENDLAIFLARNRRFRAKDGSPVYHLVRESLIPSFQCFKVTHSSALLPILNKQLRRLSEAGFIELWASRSLFSATIEGVLHPIEGSDGGHRDVESLSLEILSSAFWVLPFGFGSALLVFLLEVLFPYLTRQKLVFFK